VLGREGILLKCESERAKSSGQSTGLVKRENVLHHHVQAIVKNDIRNVEVEQNNKVYAAMRLVKQAVIL
jgi:hypothetical protein